MQEQGRRIVFPPPYTYAYTYTPNKEASKPKPREQTDGQIRHVISLGQLPDSANPRDALAAAFRHHLAELLYGFSYADAVCARLGVASALLLIQHYELPLQAGQSLGTLEAGCGELGSVGPGRVGGRWRRRRRGLLLRAYGEAGGEALQGGAAWLRRGFCGLVGWLVEDREAVTGGGESTRGSRGWHCAYVSEGSYDGNGGGDEFCHWPRQSGGGVPGNLHDLDYMYVCTTGGRELQSGFYSQQSGLELALWEYNMSMWRDRKGISWICAYSVQ